VLVAADVLCYLSDLSPFLAAAGRALSPGGLLAFSNEALMPGEGGGGGGRGGFLLRDSGRYAHSEEYVRACAEEVKCADVC
jgi:predicted TPR repeat methyltransferase